MADRDVLELALSDQREAQAHIEDLRQQIAAEEERISATEAFIATYREYEQRASSEAAESDTAADNSSDSEPADESEATSSYATPAFAASSSSWGSS